MKQLILTFALLFAFACSDSTTTFDVEYSVESDAPFTVTYQVSNHSIRTVQISEPSWIMNATIKVDNSTPNPTIVFEVKPTAQAEIGLTIDSVDVVSETINERFFRIVTLH